VGLNETASVVDLNHLALDRNAVMKKWVPYNLLFFDQLGKN